MLIIESKLIQRLIEDMQMNERKNQVCMRKKRKRKRSL